MHSQFTLSTSTLARFWAKVDVGSPDECWEWTGAKTGKGYGNFTITPHSLWACAHRVAYEVLVGPIPDGLFIDHLCRNRACVNPSHMEPVTNKVNILRGESPWAQRARMTHCANGHEFTPDNTRIRPNGTRSCRACTRERNRGKFDAAYWRDYRARRKAKGTPVGRK